MQKQILKIATLIVLTFTLSTLQANAMERKTVEKMTVLKCTSNSREIYMVCDFKNPENCVAEVLIEIQ